MRRARRSCSYECSPWAIRLVLSLLLVGSVAACGSDGGGSGAPPAPSAVIIYQADQDLDGVFELYLAGSGVKLNPPLPAGRTVENFEITPDKSAVVYVADQDTAGVFELFRVDFANPGVSTKLNGPLVANGNVGSNFQLSPDSTAVVYVADQTTDEVFELYRVPFATPGVSTKLNGPLVANGNVEADFQITPNSTAVVYRADEDTNQEFELYRVALATPGNSTKLNPPLVANGDVRSNFQITPDSTAVVYRAFQTTGELYRVSFATPGVSTKLNGPLVANGEVFDFQFTPDNAAVVYRADQDVNGRLELYRVPFTAPGVSTKLNGPLVANGDVSDFQVTPDSTAVVYRADQTTDLVDELYRVPFATPGVSTKLNPALAANGDVLSNFQLTPDSTAVVYVADQDVDQRLELYRVPFATPGVSTKLNGPLVANGVVDSLADFQFTPDRTAVVYVADQDVDQRLELYRVPFATPGVSAKLNLPLDMQRDVEGFDIR